ncbi:hypothetical protein GCM10023085_30160 [Actinomadura viridis]
MRLRGTALITAVASVALAGTAVAAPRTAEQGWSVAALTRLPGNETLSDLAVTGRTSAWAVGGSWQGAEDSALVYRWNGGTWNRVALPAQVDEELSEVDASSDNDVWAFGRRGSADPALKAFRWNGTAWQASVVEQGDVTLYDADVVSPSDVWLAASGSSGAQPLRHWNGRTWTAVSAPGRVYSLHVTSAKNGWAVGVDDEGRPQALRWNGTAWRPTTLPRLPIPEGGNATLDSVLALSPSNVWAVGATSRLVGDDEEFTPIVLHWNGTAWRTVTTPAYAFGLSNLAADGSGGLWMQGGVDTLVRYSGGTWSTAPRPVVPQSDGVFGPMANVPGTGGMLGVGWTRPWGAPEDDASDGAFYAAG